MKVLYVTAECWPFAKTGGLGDVAYALPKALKREGVDVRVMIPKYSTIPTYLKDRLKKVGEFSVDVSWRSQYCGVEQLELDGVTFYFIDNEYYFKRDVEQSIYGHGDDAERFVFFTNAVLKSIDKLGFYPDVININDWHTGMLPLYLKEKYAHLPKYSHIKTMYTIHNLQYQGIFSSDILGDILDIDFRHFNNGDIEYHGQINFMKAGINFADKVSTVSPSYAGEIKTEFYGNTLDGLIRANEHKLVGILNGIDYDINNPQTDPNIFVNYDINSLDRKVQNKIELQKLLKLEVNPNIPMVGIVSRLVSQKGLDLIFMNTAYQDESPIGKLAHDLVCVNPDDMYYEVLKERVRFYKEDRGGIEAMCESISQFEKKAKQDGFNEGRQKGKAEMINNYAVKHNISYQEAMEELGLPEEERPKLIRVIICTN